MNRVPPLTLRLRVALAFTVTTALALAALGAFLHLRVGATLESRLRDGLSAQADAVDRLPAGAREEAVRDLSGESFGQVLDATGEVVASSPGLDGPLVGPGALPPPGGTQQVETEIVLPREGELAPVVLELRRGSGDTLVVGWDTEDVEEALEGLTTQLLIGGPLALLLAAGLGYLVAAAALRPMDRMRVHAATISARSSGDRLPLPQARDEVHRLGSTLNDMLDRLDEGLRRERRFVAEASHELRTPLALLRTELDLVRSRPRSPEQLTAFLDSASEEVDRLSRVVDDLLVLASADDGRLELDLAQVDVGALLARVARRYAVLDDTRAVRVEDGPAVRVTADAGRLEQAVGNLVDNALRHGAGEVRLRATRGPGVVRVTVADEGGVPLPEELFGRFRQGEGARAGGRGLGLALVLTLATEHGGTVRTDVVDGHTVVTLELPG